MDNITVIDEAEASREDVFDTLGLDLIEGRALRDVYEQCKDESLQWTKPEMPELLLRKVIVLGNLVPVVPAVKKELAIIGGKPKKDANADTEVRPGAKSQPIPVNVPTTPDTISATLISSARISAQDTDSKDRVISENESISVLKLIYYKPCTRRRHARYIPTFTDSAIIPYTNDGVESCEVGPMYKHPPEEIEPTPSALGHMYDRLLALKLTSLDARYEILSHMPIRATAPYIFQTPSAGSEIELVKFLETLYGGKLNTISAHALSDDIRARGLDRIYHWTLMAGADAPETTAAVNIYKRQVSRQAFANAVRQEAARKDNILGELRRIVLEKLGSARLRTIDTIVAQRPSVIAEPTGLLTLLTTAEKKIVQAEHTRRQKYIEAVINNPCPHVKLHQRLRTTVRDRDAWRVYQQLRKFFAHDSDPESFIECNKCHFDIMCPHVRIIYESDRRKYTELKSLLAPFVMRQDASYLCRICGESVADDDFPDMGTSGSMDEDLKALIWSEISAVMRHIKFTKLINVPQLMSAIRNKCYPHVFQVEKRLLRAKTTSAEEVGNKTRLYALVYIMAYLVHLVTSNVEDTIKFRDFTPTGNVVAGAIKHALGLLIGAKNSALKAYGISTDTVRNQLIAAYKLMRGDAAVVAVSDPIEEKIDWLLGDITYGFVYRMWRAGLVSGAPRTQLDLSEDRRINMIDPVRKVLGSDLESLSMGEMFAGIKLVDPKVKGRDPLQSNSSRRDDPLQSNSSRRDDPLPRDDNSASMSYIQYFMDSARRFIQRSDKSEQASRLRDNITLRNSKAYNAGAGMEPGPRGVSRKVKVVKAPLGSMYDENGKRHVWEYIVGDATVSTREYAKQLEAGTPLPPYTDRKCTVCGVLASEVSTLNDEKILHAIQQAVRYENLFRYFEFKCPEGAVHEFADGVCSKCGLRKLTRDEYFNKYVDKYEEEKNVGQTDDPLQSNSSRRDDTSHSDSRQGRNTTADTSIAEDIDTDVSAPHWRMPGARQAPPYNFNLVLTLSEHVGISSKVLAALGAMQQQNLDEIQTAKYIPQEAEEKYSTRSYNIDTHIRRLVVEYSLLRNYYKLLKPPKNIADLISEARLSTEMMQSVGPMLPVLPSYDIRAVRLGSKPQEIVNFALQTFCELCLHIWDSGDKQTETLRHAFVKYIVNRVVASEQLLAAPGRFNWAIIYGEKNEQSDASAQSDPNNSDTMGLADDTRDESSDTSKPFSTDAFDMEEEADPDADTDNQVRVGEGAGLT